MPFYNKCLRLSKGIFKHFKVRREIFGCIYVGTADRLNIYNNQCKTYMPSYRNQSADVLCKSSDCFQYDRKIRLHSFEVFVIYNAMVLCMVVIHLVCAQNFLKN